MIMIISDNSDMVDSTQSFYIPRKRGRRGLISIKDCVELAIRDSAVYSDSCDERLIRAPTGEKIDELGASISTIVFYR